MKNKIQKKNISCPNCGKNGTWFPENNFRPFCSERCKIIDLGAWAEGAYHLPGEPANPDEPENDKEKDE